MGGEREARLMATIQSSMQDAVDAGVIRVRITDEELTGTNIRVDGRDLVNFGSCSYLGLGQDARLKAAASSAIDRFGPSYSSSVAYASVDLYTDLERRLTQLFDGHSVIPAPTTTLAHLAALPAIVTRDDLVVIDIQAHASMHLAVDVLRGRGMNVKVIRHNDIDGLRKVLSNSTNQFKKVWYLLDGVYSMFGDVAPVAEIDRVMDEFENLHVYYDDAHGFGWAGKNGAGYVLENTKLNDRKIVAVSLSKSFGAGGAALAIGDPALAQKILLVGGTLTFGGPIHPAVLGAAVRSADLHLSDEHAERQAQLYDRIDLVNRLVDEAGLAVPSLARTPITFVRVGTSDDAIRMTKIMMTNGFFVNAAGYPAVPIREGGVRFTVTAAHSTADIEALISTLAEYVSPPDVIDLTEELHQPAFGRRSAV